MLMSLYPFIIPALVVAPSVFSGEIEVGKVTEAQGAFVRVFFSLNVIVSRLQSLANFGAGIDRLYSFAEYLEHPIAAQAEKQDTDETPTINIVEDSRLAIEHLSLQTPNYQRTLIKDLSVELPSGQGLLIVGPSGCGKSSLLRAIARIVERRHRCDHTTQTRPDPVFTAASLYDLRDVARPVTLSQYRC